jgi:hypothetical protein
LVCRPIPDKSATFSAVRADAAVLRLLVYPIPSIANPATLTFTGSRLGCLQMFDDGQPVRRDLVAKVSVQCSLGGSIAQPIAGQK